MEIEDFETVHLAHEIAREKGWDHVMETIRQALRAAAEEQDESESVRAPGH